MAGGCGGGVFGGLPGEGDGAGTGARVAALGRDAAEDHRVTVSPRRTARLVLPDRIKLTRSIKEVRPAEFSLTPRAETEDGSSATLYKAGRLLREMKYVIMDASGTKLVEDLFKPG